MSSTLRAFLVNCSRALGVEPHHLNRPDANSDLQTALLHDVIALRDKGQAEHSLALLDAAAEAGLTSDWLADNRARALVMLDRREEALAIWESLAAGDDEGLRAMAADMAERQRKSLESAVARTYKVEADENNSPSKLEKSMKSLSGLECSQWGEKFLEKIAIVSINSNFDFEFSLNLSSVDSGHDLGDLILRKAILLREQGSVDISLDLLQTAWDSGFRSDWILDNQIRAYLAIGKLDLAADMLTKFNPTGKDQDLLKSKEDLQRELKASFNLFSEYSQSTLLREKYFQLKNSQSLSSIKKPAASLHKCLDLVSDLRDSYRFDESFLLLLLLAQDLGYDPWIEDNLARIYSGLEDWKSARNHWLNVLEKSSDLNAIEEATTRLNKLNNSTALERQETIESFGHLLFEEYCLDNNINTKEHSKSSDLANRFWLHEANIDQFVTKEINASLWSDFRCNDLYYAARYLLRNKLFHGKCLLRSIIDDGGIAFEKIVKRCRPYFDFDFYFDQRKDLDPNQVNGLEHYCLYGWKEGSNPNANFSTNAYLDQNPTLREYEINPLYFFACDVNGSNSSFNSSRDLHQLSEFILKVGAGALMRSEQIKTNSSARRSLNFLENSYHDSSKSWLNFSKDHDYSCLKIHVVIPDFAKGGGGHMTIFRMIRHLEEKGHFVTVWVVDPERNQHSADLRDDVIKHFQPIKAKVLPLDTAYCFASGDCLIATSWQTVEFVKSSITFREKYYFIQDYEPFFYARGASSVLAEQTYYEDLACICASPWLNQIVSEKFGRWSRYLWLAYDQTIYATSKDQILSKYSKVNSSDSTLHIAVYARCHTERRCVELALDSLNKLSRINSNFIVHFFGDDSLQIAPPYPAVNYGVLSHEELNTLYKLCTIGMSFSATNYSLLPQEMMASGLPVFDIKVESTTAIYPDNVIKLMEANSDAIAEVLDNCLNDPEALIAQASNALDWVQQFTWERAGDDFEKALIDKLDQSVSQNELNSYDIKKVAGMEIEPIRKDKSTFKASIVIPTYNAGPILTDVLDAIAQQQTPWNYQCIIIDSGSKDDTVQLCLDKIAQFPNLEVYSIPKGTFQHGYTRNIGVDISDAPFVVFITQDAIPANNKWLYNLVNALEANPKAAGAFGRHIAHDNADPFTSNELLNHFKGFQDLPVSISLASNEQLIQNDDQNWRKILHFYSDNNSCLRKEVWKKLPLPCVPYGEDQMWAESIIRNGYDKLYVHDAVVKHSHDYSPAETFERASTEAEFFSSCFGYEFHKDVQLAYIGISNDITHALSEGKRLKCTQSEISNRCANIYAKHLGWLSGFNV